MSIRPLVCSTTSRLGQTSSNRAQFREPITSHVAARPSFQRYGGQHRSCAKSKKLLNSPLLRRNLPLLRHFVQIQFFQCMYSFKLDLCLIWSVLCFLKFSLSFSSSLSYSCLYSSFQYFFVMFLFLLIFLSICKIEDIVLPSKNTRNSPWLQWNLTSSFLHHIHCHILCSNISSYFIVKHFIRLKLL